MKRFLVFCIVGVLSANVPLDSIVDSTISVDSHLDSVANTDLDSSNAIPPPPRNK